jgi:hypothetical protein
MRVPEIRRATGTTTLPTSNLYIVMCCIALGVVTIPLLDTKRFPLEKELLHPVCQVASGNGPEGPLGYKFVRYNQLNGPDPVSRPSLINNANASDDDKNATTTTGSPTMTPVVVAVPRRATSALPRLLCAVYTYETRHDSIKAITETQG